MPHGNTDEEGRTWYDAKGMNSGGGWLMREVCEMERPEWMERIVVEPKLHGGEPCIRGTRIPVSVIVGSIADGDTVEVLLKAYPSLTPDDIQAALKYAAEAVREGHLLPLVK